MSADTDFDMPTTTGSEEDSAEPVVAASPPPDELDRLDPVSAEVTLESGLVVAVQPLKLRQFLRLLKILTRGASVAMDSISLNTGDDDQFAQNLMALVLMAIPEAENETIDFIRSMVTPVNLTGDAATDATLTLQLDAQMVNPELEDTVSIIETIVKREASDLRALGKRLSAMMTVAQKMGATKVETTQPV